MSISEEIKDRLNIIDIIKDYIKLEKKGANYRASCPFHQEKTPSFFVSESKQIWHCFGACSDGGDVFKFIMKIEGIEYVDALRILAKKAGVQLKLPDKKTLLKESNKEIIYNICELATFFYEKQRESTDGELVKKYLLNRGLKIESIKEWRVGYGVDDWQVLINFLVNNNQGLEDIEKAGLIIPKKTGGYFDRFRKRIIFPIFDVNSRVIGFGGRVFDSGRNKNSYTEEAKYINSPLTILYNKSQVLYGLDRAKLEIRKSDFCILVEGYLDVIMLHQAGFKNAIAILGTALTPDHLQIIRRYTKNLYFCFDTDIAGESATQKSIQIALADDFNIRVVVLPKGLDPADVIEKLSFNKFQEYLDLAKPIINYFFKLVFAKFFNGKEIEHKKKILEHLLPVIKKVASKTEESYWIQELALKLNIKESIIEEEIQKIDNNLIDSNQFISINNSNKKNKKEKIEERLLVLILIYLDLSELIDLKLDYSDSFLKIISFIKRKKNIEEIQVEFSKDLNFLNHLLVNSENIMIKKEIAKEEIFLFQSIFKKIKIKEKKDTIIQKIKIEEKTGNKIKMIALIKELQDLLKNKK